MSVKKGQLRHIHIEPDTAKGSTGAHVTISKRISDGMNKGPWLRNEDEEKQSHPTPEAAAAHVLKTLKEHFSGAKTDDSGDDAVDGAKASKGGKTAKASVSHPASDDGANPSSDSWS